MNGGNSNRQPRAPAALGATTMKGIQMTTFRATVLLGAALVLGSAGVQAADLNYGGGSIKDGYVPQMTAPTYHLYGRIDGGYALFDDPIMVENGIYDLTDTSIDSTWSIGGGVGMYLSKNVRADITVDHLFETDAQGNLRDHAATLEGVRKFGMSSTVALANVYYDFDAGNRFSPYIGVGLGFTHNRTKAGTVVDPCGVCVAEIEGDSNYHVAGALMAGFTMQLRDRLAVDAGYRFLYLGETATGPVRFSNAGAGAPAVSEDPTVEDIHVHQFRVGLRYNIR